MLEKSINPLQFLCDAVPELLAAIPEQGFAQKRSTEEWSKKEILGHLIDSATNNHQRFIRVQFENVPTIIYDQNKWNTYSHYNDIDIRHLISFWEIYNRHLMDIIKHIPKENLTKTCKTHEIKNVTLQWIIEDYIVHMEHHLHQLIKY